MDKDLKQHESNLALVGQSVVHSRFQYQVPKLVGKRLEFNEDQR